MNKFRELTSRVFASPQIDAEDILAARDLGVTMVINNRPDGEEPGQPDGEAIETAARQAGIDYRAIPVGPQGLSPQSAQAMAQALADAEGKVLAYCRSGTRSTLLWALAQASTGEDPGTLAATAAAAGYDVSPVRPLMDRLFEQER